jgi:hypothetical protein
MYKITRLICLLLVSLHCSAQSTRIKTYNTIGWYNLAGSTKLTQRFDLYTEYQWRRNHVISTWQQSVLKVGLNYNLNPNVQFRLGYGWIETFPYGKYPVNAMGKDFTEHRIFEMVQLKHKEGILDLSHRFMLEQRFVGKYSSPDLEKEDQFPLVNRMRYLFRLQMPFANPLKTDRYFYGATYDEIMLSFGKNVGVNTFDQNRIGILAGYQFSNKLKLEAGYINQVVQLGRTEDQKNLFQHNNGPIVNLLFKL